MEQSCIGVDVGGTKVAAALVDASGRIARQTRMETASTRYEDLLEGILGAVARVRGDEPVGAVGVAIAGNVSRDKTHVLFAPHLPLAGEPVTADLRRGLGLPVLIENDANAAAWAEHRYGAGQSATDMLFVALGTGLGAGLVLNDSLYRGSRGFAGEAGHMTVVVDGRACPCGLRGCWERYSSGTALMAEYIERGGDPDVGGPDITTLAESGDDRARQALESVGDWLGRGLASLVAVLDPGLIVVGGGVSEAGDLLLQPARQRLAQAVTGVELRPVPEMVPAALGNEAGLVGAALLARDLA